METNVGRPYGNVTIQSNHCANQHRKCGTSHHVGLTSYLYPSRFNMEVEQLKLLECWIIDRVRWWQQDDDTQVRLRQNQLLYSPHICKGNTTNTGITDTCVTALSALSHQKLCRTYWRKFGIRLNKCAHLVWVVRVSRSNMLNNKLSDFRHFARPWENIHDIQTLHTLGGIREYAQSDPIPNARQVSGCWLLLRSCTWYSVKMPQI